ncbi:MAG: hypothetical protein AAGA62_16690, partial [Bacteroidota bacterium]
MYTRYFLIFLCLSISAFCTRGRAQTSPLDPVCTFNYQAVLRDADDRVIPNKSVKVQLTIQDGPGGNALYVEQHDATTTSLGIVVLEVGAGQRIEGTVAFEFIPWAIRKHYLRVEVDPDGNDNFVDLGEAPILAVPIAVQAKIAAYAMHTMDTITIYDSLIVSTICVDTLKADLGFIDTLVTKIGFIDTLINDKIFGRDICFLDENGNEVSVLSSDSLGAVSANIDSLLGCVYADTLKVSDFISFERNDVQVGAIGYTATGRSSVDMEIILSNKVYTDSTFANVICAEKIKADTIVGDFFDTDYLAGCTSFDTLKSTGFISFDDEEGNQVGAIGVNVDGESSIGFDFVHSNAVYSDSVVADITCTRVLKAD